MKHDLLISDDKVYRTSSGIPIQNLWYMLLYVWNSYQKKDRWRFASETSPTLDGLLSSVLANLMQQRLRVGLGRSYEPERSVISGIRGQVDFAESVKRLTFQRGRSCCRFENFISNIPRNQIIRSILARMAQIGDFGYDSKQADALRSRLRRLVSRLDGIDLIELRMEEIRRQKSLPSDADYAMMLSICALIQQRLMPMHGPGQNRLPGMDHDTMTMCNIYERFIANFYSTHLSSTWLIRSQRTARWNDENDSRYLPTMKFDLEMQYKLTGKLIVLDTKFTKHALVTGQWGNHGFDRNHLYQIYAYLRSQEDRSSSHRSSTGILLYPATSVSLSEVSTIQGHRIRWETIDLAQPWRNIERNLLKIPLCEL